MGNKIDVIIPAYKAQNTIIRTLSSIALQNIKDDVKVTIVNDADGIGYKEFVDMFSKHLDIQELTMEKNGGPGDSRQYGFENTSNPYVIFIDADDTFSGAFALKTLRMNLESDPRHIACWSNFLEEQIDHNNNDMPNYIQHTPGVWMFGELFKRDFLVKNKVKFLKGSRSNEDSGFNMIVKLLQNQNEFIKVIPDITYYWHNNDNSITRINGANYSYDRSFQGITRNWIYAIKHAEKMNPFNGAVMQHKVSCMCNLYEYYIETVARDSRYIEQNWNCCRRFYSEIYREIKGKITDEIFAQIYNDVMRNCYMGNKLYSIVPCIGIKEFLKKMEEEYDPEEKEFAMTDDSYPYEKNLHE